METNTLFAFGLTLFAGLATGIGSLLIFFTNRSNTRFLAVATAFSSGVMLYVSFVEILLNGSHELALQYGPRLGEWINVAAFFGGILLIGIIDNLIPSAENPHETYSTEEIAPLKRTSLPDQSILRSQTRQHRPAQGQLMRMGLFTALALGIHNFPEGLATFMAALKDPALGVAIALAIALHNIPEGISVAVPVFYATGNRTRAFVISFLSGLAEPVGAAIAYLVLTLISGGSIPPTLMGILFAAVAGIMVYISLDELLPTSRAYGQGHDTIFGLVAGMAVMAVSLLLLR